MEDEELEQSIGAPAFSWTFLEYHPHERGKWWWVIFWVVSIGLVAYAGYTKNFLFAVIVLIFDIIILYQHYGNPQPVECEIYDHGVIVGAEYLPWKQIKKFWIAYDPPVIQRLYLVQDKLLKPHYSITFEGVDPADLRSFLKQYVSEDQDHDDEHYSDTLSRLLKI